MSSTVINLGPLFDQVLWPALSVVAMAIAGWIAAKIGKHVDSKVQEQVRVLVNGTLQSGLQLAQAKLASANIERPAVQSEIVADALNYAIANGAEAFKKLGIDLSTEAGKIEAADKLRSLLAPAVMVAVASPVPVSVATAASIANPSVPLGTVPVADVNGVTVDPTLAAKPPT